MPSEMHYLLAERYRVAQERVTKAVKVLAKHPDFDLPDEAIAGLQAHHHDPQKQQVYRAESSADVLEAIVAGLKAKKAEEKKPEEKPVEKKPPEKPAAKTSAKAGEK